MAGRLPGNSTCEEPAVAQDFSERDWKVLREVRSVALERFCERILSEITRIAKDASASGHERYLLIYQLVQDRDADIAAAFNDLRRSTALRQLAMMQTLDVLSAEELARFSADTQASIKGLSEIFRPKKKSARR
jgi:hypothetical protein